MINRTKYLLLVVTIISLCLMSSHVGAELIMDGGTISKGEFGKTLQLGADVPSVIYYGARLDYGVLDRWQIGGYASALIFFNTIGLANKFNIISTEDKSFNLGLDLLTSYTIGYVIIAKTQRFTLNPMLISGFRFGDEKNTVLYFKAGTTSTYMSDSETFLAGYWDEDGQPSTAVNSWEHAFKGGMGVGHAFTEGFSMYLEGGTLVNIKDPSIDNLTYFVVLGFQFF